MNKNNIQKEKIPYAVTMANNKKQAEIKNILSLRDEMIKNSIDNDLIKQFLDDQYNKINKEYEERINKYNQKQNPQNNQIKKIKKKREKAIEFLLKNKTFLEEHGASKEYIKKYVNKQYQEINEYYDITNIQSEQEKNKVNDVSIDFID
jgi:hypothetical protein